MPDVLCTCKSHCTTYNHETRSYHGGQFINRITASRHHQDNSRSATLDGFASHVASSILSETPGLGIIQASDETATLSPLQTAGLPGVVITLKGEIRDWVSWMATGRHLVFATDPVPDLDFETPLASPHYIPNNGRHALHPSNPNNISFIKNKGRLFEILGNLRTDTLAIDQEVLDDLTNKVNTGLHWVMEHKRHEWERQQSKTRAIAKGHTVIKTGQIPKAS